MKSVVPIEYHSTNLNLHRCWDGDMGRSDMPLGFSSGHLPSLMFCLWAYRSPECSTVNSGIPETPHYTCSVSVIALATNLRHPTSTRQSLAALHRLQAQPLPLKWLVHSILPRHCYLCQSRQRTESWTIVPVRVKMVTGSQLSLMELWGTGPHLPAFPSFGMDQAVQPVSLERAFSF